MSAQENQAPGVSDPGELGPDLVEIEADPEVRHIPGGDPLYRRLRPSKVERVARVREYRLIDDHQHICTYRGAGLTPEGVVAYVRKYHNSHHDGSLPVMDRALWECGLCVALIRDYDSPDGDLDVFFFDPPPPKSDTAEGQEEEE